MAQNIVNEIINTFTENTGIKAKWKAVKPFDKTKGFDGQLDIMFHQGSFSMATEIKKTVRLVNIPDIIKLHKLNSNMIVMAEDIIPAARKYLKNTGINYIDGLGNTYINGKDVLIVLDASKNKGVGKDYKSQPFSKTGLKVMFHLFVNDDLINDTIRRIAEDANVSLDTVHRTINGLKQLNYLLTLTKDKLTWNNKNVLVQKWITDYEMRLKPGLKMGNFRFLKEEDFYQWQKLNLNNLHTRWAGEAAADLLTNYLKPQILTLYTNESISSLIKNLRIVPDPDGYIELYEKFWAHDDPTKNTVHPLLVYTDLINSGSSRNIEVAKKIDKKFNIVTPKSANE